MLRPLYSSAGLKASSFSDSNLFRISIFVIRISFPVRIFGADCQRDSTARGELRGDRCLARRAGFHEIVENAVCDGFIECALVTIGCEIKFERFAFNAQTVGNVIDVDPSKIRLAGYGANRSEIVSFEMNTVIALRRGIWKGLESRLGG